MKIAFISYEFPPDTAFGGIATYVEQAAQMMHTHGHHVEVFAASHTRTASQEENGVWVHRFITPGRMEFSDIAAKGFIERHKEIDFDVVEGPDYYADARSIVRRIPDIPLVVKLHSSSYQTAKAGDPFSATMAGLRIRAGRIRRARKFADLYSLPDSIDYIEREHTRMADEIAAPSLAIGQWTRHRWKLDSRLISHVPLPYRPSAALLGVSPNTYTRSVTFLGRLEKRKGVYTLAYSIPIILKKYPGTHFRFIGRSTSAKIDADLQSILRSVQASVEFTGPVSLETIPSVLAETDVCVFPSNWENFPLVCLESLAAARGVVGSRAGGMREILDDGRVGKLVPPRSPRHIANAVIELLENPEERIRLGIEGRKRILECYNFDRIGKLHEESYLRAIQRRKQIGPRRNF